MTTAAILPHLTPALASQLDSYLALLLRWNARTNLTAIREPEEIVRRHFAESLFAAGQLPPGTLTLLDYGSGAGFPGIPIALARPEIAFTLAESQSKKAAFLREAIRTLGLKAEVWSQRVEELPPARLFDAITLRAVDKMAEACRSAAERLAPDGTLLAFATETTEPALAAISEIRWERSVVLPGPGYGFIKLGKLAR